MQASSDSDITLYQATLVLWVHGVLECTVVSTTTSFVTCENPRSSWQLKSVSGKPIVRVLSATKRSSHLCLEASGAWGVAWRSNALICTRPKSTISQVRLWIKWGKIRPPQHASTIIRLNTAFYSWLGHSTIYDTISLVEAASTVTATCPISNSRQYRRLYYHQTFYLQTS
jgi:hypothetical protein